MGTGFKGVLSKEQLVEIFRLQKELNILYTGEDWRKNTKRGWWLTSAQTEWAEMMVELEDQWKWYNKHATHDYNKALFELADVLHFLVGGILHYCPDKLVHGWCPMNQGISSCQFNAADYIYMSDRGDPFLLFQSRFALCCYDVSVGRISSAIVNMNRLVGELCHQYEFDANMVYVAYVMKNERNRDRVAGGVMQGVYDKSKETELKL